MIIKPLHSELSTNEHLFESYFIDEINNFSELIDVFNDFRDKYPDKSILLALDDLRQAEYTSTHSIMKNSLDETEGFDLSGLDLVCFENGEHIGYLSTPSEFFIRKENFLKQVSNIHFSDVCDNRLSIDESEVLLLKNINLSPLDYLDKSIILKIVPVDKSYLSLCGFPNGYFVSDLDPFENYALAKFLYEKYGYELFGVGASLLGFIRKEILEKEISQDLISDLSKLYNCTESMLESIIEPIQSRKYMFLKYVEYLQK